MHIAFIAGRAGRRFVTVVSALGLVLSSPIAASTTRAAVAGCPPAPWTLADVVRVPSLWEETPWAPAAARRVACFGHASISFVALGGMLMAAFPGVEIAPAFGRTMYLISDPTATSGWDLNAWVPPDIGMGPEDLRALDMTSPGLSIKGWHDVWWQGSGHFDDPAAADCRPDDGTSTIDGVPLALTPVEAIEFCRNEFVLDELDWLSVPPTDTLVTADPASTHATVIVVAGALAIAIFVAVLGGPARSRRRG